MVESRLKYRPEVDGLRAVAVIPVILFHASPTLLSGGFLGVDVFFVISGFLITALLLEDMAAGTYTLARFYERRVRRILPALLVMVVVTVVLAWALMLPRGFGNTARSAAAAAAFLSNVFFWQTTDYFDIDALAQPLYCWSLAVEEQFYILFPVLLALAWRRVSVRVLVLGLIGLTLASLALADWGSAVHPKVNYYFTFSRFWELFLGSLGAFALRYRQMRARPVLAGIGLAAVIVSMVLFRPATPHPGPWTLIPVLGTLMVLLWADADRGVGRLLAMRPVVAVGKISYSLYLWHYPIFSFAAAQGPVSDEVWNVVAQIAVVFAVSVASWRFVETPFRHRRAGQGPARALWIGAGAVAAVIALGQVLGRFPDVTLRYLTATPEARQMLMFAETYGRGPKEKSQPDAVFLFDRGKSGRYGAVHPAGAAQSGVVGRQSCGGAGHGFRGGRICHGAVRRAGMRAPDQRGLGAVGGMCQPEPPCDAGPAGQSAGCAGAACLLAQQARSDGAVAADNQGAAPGSAADQVGGAGRGALLDPVAAGADRCGGRNGAA